MNGLRPNIEFMTWNFAVLAFDQIVNNAAKMYNMSGGQYHVPIVFRGASGSAGQLGATHSQSFENWLSNVPGLKVVSLSCPYDAKGLLKSAIIDDDPVCVMESELMYGDKGMVPEEEYYIPIGKADIKRVGKDVTLISFGKMMKVVLAAAEELAKEGIEAEVIDLMSLRPIDYATLVQSAKKTNRVLFVEESWPLAGMGSEIAYHIQRYAFDHLDAPVMRITSEDVPMSYAPTLVDAFLPNPEKVIKRVKDLMYIKA
jgi:pyruvate dehydrogenase E1 component beta subunit